MTLKQLLANTEQSDNLKQQLEEERKQLRQVREQNTILSERVAGLEHQLKNRQAEAEKIDSLQQQWISQKELVSAAKEENAALKERTKQLDEQVKILNERSEKFALTTAELNQEKTRVSELTQRNAADQQRIKILEDQIAQGKQVAMRLDQLTQAEAVAEKNQRLNQQLGFMQRDLEAAEKKNRAIEQSRELESSPQEIGAIAGEKLERILGQLESQNRQISELVQENKNMALELASRKPTKRSKTTVIPDGHDDLTKIVGIGPMSQKKLYELGVKTHSQIAGWSEEDITKYSQQLGYKNNRIEQENWVAQAKNFHDTGTKRTS